jgi:hypothetical protein
LELYDPLETPEDNPLTTHICCFQSQYQQIYELSKKLFSLAGNPANKDLPEIQGFLARLRAIDAGVRGLDWKLARDQRNEMVHDYPCTELWVRTWPALERVIEPIALRVRGLAETASELDEQVKDLEKV